MKRRVFTSVTGLSAVICGATCLLWVGSYFRYIEFGIYASGTQTDAWTERYSFEASRGSAMFHGVGSPDFPDMQMGDPPLPVRRHYSSFFQLHERYPFPLAVDWDVDGGIWRFRAIRFRTLARGPDFRNSPDDVLDRQAQDDGGCCPGAAPSAATTVAPTPNRCPECGKTVTRGDATEAGEELPNADESESMRFGREKAQRTQKIKKGWGSSRVLRKPELLPLFCVFCAFFAANKFCIGHGIAVSFRRHAQEEHRPRPDHDPILPFLQLRRNAIPADVITPIPFVLINLFSIEPNLLQLRSGGELNRPRLFAVQHRDPNITPRRLLPKRNRLRQRPVIVEPTRVRIKIGNRLGLRKRQPLP